MKVATIGIDIAKNVFQVHGIDEKGNIVLGKKLRRPALLAFFGKLAKRCLCCTRPETCSRARKQC